MPFSSGTTIVSGPSIGSDALRGVRDLPRFDGQQDRVDCADAARIVRGLRMLDDEVAVDAVDAKAARAQRVERGAAGDERRVDARVREPAAEVAADSAGADDRDLHFSLFFHAPSWRWVLIQMSSIGAAMEHLRDPDDLAGVIGDVRERRR